jgi:(p)ppGpp synthase/HD superfamily hydrolase
MNEFVEEARDFAIKRHGEQLYGNEPYIVHLDHVHEVGLRFGTTIEEQCADYLHDILEDTDCSFEEIWYEFGWYVAHLVFLVTDEDGDNRKERKRRTYPKIRSNSDAIRLKLRDRIANVESSKQNNPKLFQMYKQEHEEFLTELHISGTRYGLLGEMIATLNNLFEC